MREEITARARATVTLEIDLGSTWGSDCNMKQVFNQARDDAKRVIREISTPRIRLVGEIQVTPILMSLTR